MQRFTLILLLLIVAWVASPTGAGAQAANSSGGSVQEGHSAEDATLSGTKFDNADIANLGTQWAIRHLFTDKWQEWASQVLDDIGNWCIEILFRLYDKFIGAFLIGIPDVANKSTYQGPNAPDPAGAVEVVGNIYKVTWALGLYFLVVFFVAYVGITASGTSTQIFSPKMLLRFFIVGILLFAWGPIFSALVNGFSSLGFLIYSQNHLNTSGVLSALKNLSLDPTQDSITAATDLTSNSRYIFLNTIGMTWNVIYTCAIFLIVIGVMVGASFLSEGDSNGRKQIFRAVGALVVIVALPTVLQIMVKRGAPTIGMSTQQEVSQGYNLFGSQANITESGKPIVPQGNPQQQPGSSSGQPSLLNQAMTTAQQSSQVILTHAIAGILKILVSLWGVMIIVTVLIAKLYQIFGLVILFLLGPVFIGLAAHPSTASISWGAFRMFIKFLSYSPIWGLLLVMLYLIPNINLGVGSIGVNSVLTAFAVLVGLQMIGDAREWAGLFAHFGGGQAAGGGISGEGWKQPYRSATGAIGSLMGMAGGKAAGAAGGTGTAGAAGAAGAGAVGAASGGATLALMAAGGAGGGGGGVGQMTGAALGTVVPGLGTAAGAAAGGTMDKSMKKLSSFAGGESSSGDRQKGSMKSLNDPNQASSGLSKQNPSFNTQKLGGSQGPIQPGGANRG